MHPSADDQEWLIRSMATVIRKHGASPFLDAPLIGASQEWFPDPWTRDRPAVERVLQRLLSYAGIPQIRARVEIERRGYVQGAWHPHDDAPAWFCGIDERRVAHFGCLDTHFDDPSVLVAHLCHEVAHAWRFHHRAMVEDTDEEELLTDLTTVYLGFGLFTGNASFKKAVYHDGARSGTQTSRSGYLSLPHFAYLLAAQAVCRELGWCDRRGVANQLGQDQATLFRSWYRRLVTPAGELRWRLGLPSTYDPPKIAIR